MNQDPIVERVRRIGGEFLFQLEGYLDVTPDLLVTAQKKFQALCDLMEAYPQLNTDDTVRKLLWGAHYTDTDKVAQIVDGCLATCTLEHLQMADQVTQQEWLRDGEATTTTPDIIDLFAVLWVLAAEGCPVPSAKALERCCWELKDLRVLAREIIDQRPKIASNLAVFRKAVADK